MSWLYLNLLPENPLDEVFTLYEVQGPQLDPKDVNIYRLGFVPFARINH